MGQSGDTAGAMSQVKTKTVQGVRLPPAREARQHRTLDERILVRFPALVPRLVAVWARLPRHSRLRRVMLVRLVRQGYAAVNRRDFDLTIRVYDPGCYEYHPEQVALPDSDPVYYGHDGFHKFWRQLLEAFDDVRLDPKEIFDLGDRVLVTIQMSGHGTGSGVSVNQQLFQVMTFRRGVIVRQDDYQDRAQALEAAGLSE
jgi:ketosteroid isomerase-like protein